MDEAGCEINDLLINKQKNIQSVLTKHIDSIQFLFSYLLKTKFFFFLQLLYYSKMGLTVLSPNFCFCLHFDYYLKDQFLELTNRHGQEKWHLEASGAFEGILTTYFKYS